MASVRMTQEMRNNIRNRAEDAYETANPKPQPSTEFTDAVKQAITDSPEQKFYEQILQIGKARGLDSRYGTNILPFQNKEDVSAIDLRLSKLDAPKGDYEQHTIKFSTPIKPYLVIEQSYNRWGNPSVYVNDLDGTTQTEIKKQFEDLLAAQKEWDEAFWTYKKSIRDLLEQCTTLKQLLEVWPAAESLVDSAKLSQMHVKVTRKQRAEQIKQEINFDPTVANQTVLTAKLLGG